MPYFNIVKTNEPETTFRTSKIQADYDVKFEHSCEHFEGNLELPDEWQIGVIVGNSGTGKSTIAEKMFYSVGFGSVPSWLKPYSVLSNGEKMRVDLARAMLEHDKICFDEFTSVVDRNVAKTTCIAIGKAVKQMNKQFIAVTCHEDILEWLQPDWVFNTNTMTTNFSPAHVLQKNSLCENVGKTNGRNLGVIII